MPSGLSSTGQRFHGFRGVDGLYVCSGFVGTVDTYFYQNTSAKLKVRLVKTTAVPEPRQARATILRTRTSLLRHRALVSRLLELLHVACC